MSESLVEIGLAVMAAAGAIVAGLFRRELKHHDDRVADIHKTVFGFDNQAGLRERTSALETQSKALEVKSETLFEKLDKILSKIEALTEILAKYSTETALVKSSVDRMESNCERHHQN